MSKSSIMKYFVFNFLMGSILFGLGCSSTEQLTANSSIPFQNNAPDTSQSIALNINEVVYFEFNKVDTVWSGNLTTFSLNDEGEKIIDREFVSVNDSTWNDFDNFVNSLKILNLPPQNKIEGWVPDSSKLPRRVYNFETFDGDTTRFFSYQDPINGIRDYWQLQNVLIFVTYIQNELHWVPKE